MTEEQVNKIGEKLAEWSTHHQKTIKISGKPINLAGVTYWALGVEQTADGPRRSCRGTAMIQWQTGLAADDNNSILRENLRSVIQQNDCNGEVLLAYVRKLDDIEELTQLTAEKLAEGLSCLGQFEFTSVEIE
jgi:hypothetical protein